MERSMTRGEYEIRKRQDKRMLRIYAAILVIAVVSVPLIEFFAK